MSFFVMTLMLFTACLAVQVLIVPAQPTPMPPVANPSYHSKLMMLWSDGRCGTTSLTNTMFRSFLITYCRTMEKEAFNYRYASAITKKDILDLCTNTGNPLPVFMHIKPLHVLNVTGQTGGDMHERDRYRTIQAFFNDAYEAGVKLLMVIRRENLLAHMVSVFELHTAGMTPHQRHKHANEVFVGKDIIEYIKRKYVETEIGVMQAKMLHMPVMEYEFSEATADVCNTTLEIAHKMKEVGLIEQGYIDNFKCERWEFSSLFTKGAKVDSTHPPLGVRVGKDSARYIESQLRNTPWEWMLDVNRKRRPEFAHNPCLDIAQCIPNSLQPNETFVPM